MPRYSLEDLKELDQRPTVFIHATEGSIYTATCETDEHKPAVIYRDETHALQTRSLEKMKEHFRDINLQAAYLVHRSAYDEMIGTETYAAPSMVKLCWSGSP